MAKVSKIQTKWSLLAFCFFYFEYLTQIWKQPPDKYQEENVFEGLKLTCIFDWMFLSHKLQPSTPSGIILWKVRQRTFLAFQCCVLACLIYFCVNLQQREILLISFLEKKCQYFSVRQKTILCIPDISLTYFQRQIIFFLQISESFKYILLIKNVKKMSLIVKKFLKILSEKQSFSFKNFIC